MVGNCAESSIEAVVVGSDCQRQIGAPDLFGVFFDWDVIDCCVEVVGKSHQQEIYILGYEKENC